MFFRLDTRKAIEATATLLRLAHHRTMSRKRLLALLYIADRESLSRTGRPIIGGRLAALPHGPIHSEVYDLIKGGHSDELEWSRHFQNEGRFIRITHDVGTSALSRFEVGLLNEISDRHFGDDVWDIVLLTHKFEEYKQSYREGSSAPISLEQVIDAVGRRKDKETILR